MAYPSSLDELTDGVPSDGAAPTTALDNATYPHDDHHRALGVAVEAVEAELGTDPSGASATVKARLDALDVTVAAKVPASLVDAAGDLMVGSAADTLARLPMGTALQTLRVNAGATGLEYAAASGGDTPWLVPVNVHLPPAARSGFTTTSVNTSRIMNGSRSGSVVQNSYIEWNLLLGAGTWAVDVMTSTYNGSGIITVSLDGSSVGTIDLYSAGVADNVQQSLTGVTVAATGVKAVRLTMATKNASSSAYDCVLNGLQLRRTA